MERVPEPELMDAAEQVSAYADADFEAAHSQVIMLLREKLQARLPASGNALDLGCGPADISIRFLKSFPNYHVTAIDGSKAMLQRAEIDIEKAGLTEAISTQQMMLQDLDLHAQNYDLIFSNSLLHHLHDPELLWRQLKTANQDALVFIMDLHRPTTDEEAKNLVETYSASEPDILKHDFYHSLKAAFTVAEVIAQLEAVGLDKLEVEQGFRQTFNCLWSSQLKNMKSG